MEMNTSKKRMMKGRIDNIGRLILTFSQMKDLGISEGDMIGLDIRQYKIEISKSLETRVPYDRVKVLPNGILMGIDFCRSKLLMTKERVTIEKNVVKIYDADNQYLSDEEVETVFYSVDFYIENNKLIIPITAEQFNAELRHIRMVDEFGRVLLPAFMRKLHDITDSVGIKLKGKSILLSNTFKEKTKVNELGMVSIPEKILYTLDIELKSEMNVETSHIITLTKLS